MMIGFAWICKRKVSTTDTKLHSKVDRGGDGQNVKSET
jgi:hypothetical protein